jgi:predicted choloylglycine hydrolase
VPERLFPVTVFGINEPTPGPRWRSLFDATWPAYRAWYLGRGDAARPDLDTASAMLARHMPELVQTHENLVGLTGGDETAARMLTLWNAPAFLPGCAQAALTGPTPALCRNYDYSPDLWERTIYTSAFTGRRVIGSGDCLWGLLDGMNDAGLVVSLTFGGRPGSGPGFAIPLVVRYLLEVAGNVREARELLQGLPIAMSYNLTMVDVEGRTGTAFVAPGEAMEFTDAPVATNHRGRAPEYPAHAARLGPSGSGCARGGVPGRAALQPELFRCFRHPVHRAVSAGRAGRPVPVAESDLVPRLRRWRRHSHGGAGGHLSGRVSA